MCKNKTFCLIDQYLFVCSVCILSLLIYHMQEDLPEYFKPWEYAAKNVITLLEEKKLREFINKVSAAKMFLV